MDDVADDDGGIRPDDDDDMEDDCGGGWSNMPEKLQIYFRLAPNL